MTDPVHCYSEEYHPVKFAHFSVEVRLISDDHSGEDMFESMLVFVASGNANLLRVWVLVLTQATSNAVSR